MKKIKFFALFAVCLLVLCSCAEKITLEEVKEVLPTLVENSKPLNEIYFGEGFKEDETLAGSAVSGYYYCDTSEYGLNSVLEIKDATEKVFTPEYAEVLYQAAFEGLSTDTVVSGARFVEADMGLMQKAGDEQYDIADREFDYNSLAIKKSGSKKVTVTVDTYIGGEKDETVSLIINRYGEEGSYSYLLDSPTY
ncbi:MAG: hypothetical protein IJ002_07900 [Clostridia bacterium]|nr:hypothetical protein [Clostridia bacterium]